MSVFKGYRINGSTLELEAYQYWDFKPHQPDAVFIWTLINVRPEDLQQDKLDQLIDYQEDAGIEEISIGNQVRLVIDTSPDQSLYEFTCDRITTSTRTYNVDEVTSFLVRHLEYRQKEAAAATRTKMVLDVLTRHIHEAAIRKYRIIANESGSFNQARIKAEHQLDILLELQNILDEQTKL